jgi:hypothetical protein
MVFAVNKPIEYHGIMEWWKNGIMGMKGRG